MRLLTKEKGRKEGGVRRREEGREGGREGERARERGRMEGRKEASLCISLLGLNNTTDRWPKQQKLISSVLEARNL